MSNTTHHYYLMKNHSHRSGTRSYTSETTPVHREQEGNQPAEQSQSTPKPPYADENPVKREITVNDEIEQIKTQALKTVLGFKALKGALGTLFNPMGVTYLTTDCKITDSYDYSLKIPT